MSKPEVRIENWSAYEYSGGVLLLGQAYGHPRFADGTHVHTSRVVGLVNDSTAETLNSMYHLGKPATEQSLARLKEAFAATPSN